MRRGQVFSSSFEVAVEGQRVYRRVLDDRSDRHDGGNLSCIVEERFTGVRIRQLKFEALQVGIGLPFRFLIINDAVPVY